METMGCALMSLTRPDPNDMKEVFWEVAKGYKRLISLRSLGLAE